MDALHRPTAEELLLATARGAKAAKKARDAAAKIRKEEYLESQHPLCQLFLEDLPKVEIWNGERALDLTGVATGEARVIDIIKQMEKEIERVEGLGNFQRFKQGTMLAKLRSMKDFPTASEFENFVEEECKIGKR